MKAEEELCTRRKAYRDIVEKSPDAIVMAKNEKILFINEMGINLLKANHAKDVIQKSILDFIPTGYHTKAKERMMLISKGETTNFSEYEIIRMDGSTFTAEIKSIPTFFQN
ncbi:PAS domain S-box protein [Heyndrickxia sporothermodurans]|uniref:PAS domain S-box protein n=1 Tax=Heyndrickxia sporothermodurans TaxID=46224 RepID=UPI002E2BFE1D|nr:PAS domain S-box protein [Heyndrickxia sporothermodurans]